MNKVKIKIYAGGGWEGHVVYYIEHPNNSSCYDRVSSVEEIKNFCIKNELLIDEIFLELVRKYLYFDKKYYILSL
jgi:hypothetical protein